VLLALSAVYAFPELTRTYARTGRAARCTHGPVSFYAAIMYVSLTHV